MEHDTVVYLTAAYAKHGSYRQTAKALGVSHAAVWNILNGRTQDVGRKTESKVRVALGLQALPNVQIVRRSPPSRLRDMRTEDVARMIRGRYEY